MGAAAKLGGRLGEDRDPGGAGEAGQRLAQPGVGLAPGDDQGPLRAAEVLGELADREIVRGGRAGCDRGQRPPLAALQRQRIGRGDGARLLQRRQWLAPGEIQVDRARPGVAAGGGEGRGRRPSGSAGDRRRRPRGCRPRRTSGPSRRRASAGRSSGRRRSRAAPAGGRRSGRSAARPTRRPRRPPGGSWRRRSPRCRASPPAPRVAWAAPRAKKAAERSSTITLSSIEGSR